MGNLVIDNQFLPVACSLVQQAKSSIEISSFKIEETSRSRGQAIQKFWNLIKDKAKAGLKIKLLINWNDEKRSVAKTNFSTARDLLRYGVRVRKLKNNRCCHAKVILVDKQQAILGSHNLSIKSVCNNFEISYLTSDPESVDQLSSVFSKTWLDADKF